MQPANDLMLHAARAFIAALSPAQREAACFAFEDEERFTWHFTPIPRRGVPLRDLLPAQQKLAHALISTGYSPIGAMKAAQIMSLEQVLHEFESERRFVRDPDLYFISIFGEPAPDRTWGWRLEGHHVSLSVTLAEGKQLATTPCFFGANPAEVKLGPRKGLRVLENEEEIARSLLHSLDKRQSGIAIVDAAAPDDILSYNLRRAQHLGDAGIAVSELSVAQRGQLFDLLEVYASALPAEAAAARMEKVHATPSEQLRFAWAGGANRGERHYYRIQGPAFLVEYDNTQNDANHIHSVWRDFAGDWGIDLLGRHLRESHATEKNAVAAGAQRRSR